MAKPHTSTSFINLLKHPASLDAVSYSDSDSDSDDDDHAYLNIDDRFEHEKRSNSPQRAQHIPRHYTLVKPVNSTQSSQGRHRLVYSIHEDGDDGDDGDEGNDDDDAKYAYAYRNVDAIVKEFGRGRVTATSVPSKVANKPPVVTQSVTTPKTPPLGRAVAATSRPTAVVDVHGVDGIPSIPPMIALFLIVMLAVSIIVVLTARRPRHGLLR